MADRGDQRDVVADEDIADAVACLQVLKKLK